jgi:ribonuclease PH
MVPWGSPRCYGRNARFEQAAKPLRSALAAEPARERPGGHDVGHGAEVDAADFRAAPLEADASAAATRPQIPKNGWIPPAKRFRCPGVSEPSTADDGRSKPNPPGTAPGSDPSVSVHLLRKRDGRPPNVLRPVTIQCGFQRLAEGSVLYSAGGTVVLVTASVDETVPEWMKGRGRGWVTAEYQMHPRANPRRRERRDGRERPLGGRTREIERLIGRALRSAVALDALGERSITIDCDVLEADGGTRTAAVTGGFVALALALGKLRTDGRLTKAVLRDQVAAVSVGHVDGALALDLCYAEDSTARVDLNLVATAGGAIVEVQGTAEGEAVPRAEIDAMIDLGLAGIAELCRLQRTAIETAGVPFDPLFR